VIFDLGLITRSTDHFAVLIYSGPDIPTNEHHLRSDLWWRHFHSDQLHPQHNTAPTIVIPGMAELGTTHFPAGAAYILLASGDLGWGDLEIFLLGVAIANLTTVCIV